MKFAFGALVVAALLGAGLLWQRHTNAVAEAAPAPFASVPSAPANGLALHDAHEPTASNARDKALDGLPPGWSSVIVGEPSGAASAPGSSSRAEPATAIPGASSGALQPDSTTPTVAPITGRTFELTIQKGQTLSTICQEHYKTAQNELVAALARANHLADAGSVREGQKLVLPPLESLLPKRP